MTCWPSGRTRSTSEWGGGGHEKCNQGMQGGQQQAVGAGWFGRCPGCGGGLPAEHNPCVTYAGVVGGRVTHTHTMLATE
jgi:hypothetical protein